ncbi:DNA repair exonuclease SbcCD ATPase subunit [Halomonas campaniensis]|uniref:DNA repair exonuclease SbcCD ATPase subunit n=1 Tax=Halomonas campaniensis TaxID=213554 RepID=A0A7W5K231_9GAMM|nr:hypothetical protein [Halomonas campaniensis]MBB3330416.1 DNA repair exonuclease SbcCD ATPase subunit [Halomonas campaniensis]
MAKQTATAKIDAQLAQAVEAEEQATALEEQARQAYQDALAAGDMAAADVATVEVERQVRAAGIARDRLEILEEQRIEAAAQDAKPAHQKALKALDDAFEAERQAHDELAALVRQVAEVRAKLDGLHNASNAAIKGACAAADAAHEPSPSLQGRSSLDAHPEVMQAFTLAREIANIAGHQAQLIFTAQQRARGA